MTVDLPEGTHGSVAVERFEVVKNVEWARLLVAGRYCPEGHYTRLMRNGELWMSDTPMEKRDHATAAFAINQMGGRVLIGGLGLGMILRVALLTPTVTEIDVVDIDHDVLALVGPHYAKMAAELGKILTFHEADVLTIKWPKGTRWSVAWFDIWPYGDTKFKAEMTKLRRSYGQRADWCGCWSQYEMGRL
jgi:hypothetical protein